MFFRTCKIVDRPCFLAGIGLSMLIYFCATGYRNISIINGKERGSKLEFIKQIDEKTLKQLLKNNAFLDNETGDIYSYNEVLY